VIELLEQIRVSEALQFAGEFAVTERRTVLEQPLQAAVGAFVHVQ
jgi:hypothetical protein